MKNTEKAANREFGGFLIMYFAVQNFGATGCKSKCTPSVFCDYPIYVKSKQYVRIKQGALQSVYLQSSLIKLSLGE